MPEPVRVLSVASECAPLVKTGGLADVVGALPGALAGHAVEMRVLLPAYRGLAGRLRGPERISLPISGNGAVELIVGTADGLALILLDAPELYDREGGPYVQPGGGDWPDNAARFGLLARVGARIAAGGLAGWVPDAVHVHDWQAALVPVYLRAVEEGGPPTLLTIHNIAFQGIYPAGFLATLGLPRSVWRTEGGVEFWGHVGFLKGGLAMADRISTVSAAYAEELTSPAFGLGLDGLLRARAGVFRGILNGIDMAVWDPANDPHIAAPFSAQRPAGKARSRTELAERFGLEPPPGPLFVVVSRMTRQKGLDLLLEALPALVDRGAALAVLGSGERDLEAGFTAAAAAYRGHVGVVTGYDEPLSHLCQGGGDAILIPSRFEPCGLTQLYGLRYGTLPVAARTGGLGDTVIDATPMAVRSKAATGVLHAPDSADALARAIDRACDLFADRSVWRQMRRTAMKQDVSWDASAADYAGLYREMVAA